MSYVGSSSAMVETLREGDISQFQYDEPKRGLNINRIPKKFQPTNTQTFTSGNNDTIRLRLPSDMPADFRRAFLLMDVTILSPGSTYRRMSFGSWSFIDKIRIHCSNETIEEQQYYNRIHSALFTLQSNPDYYDAIGSRVYGTGSQAERNALGASTSYRVAVPISAGYFTTGVLPLHATKNFWTELEIYLAPANTVIETDGLTPSYTLSNIDIHYEAICSWNGTYERSLSELVDRAKFNVWFNTFTTFQNNVINQQSDLIIANRQESVNQIISWMYNTGTVTSTTTNDKFITFAKNDAFSYQLKFNNRLWPDEEIRTDNDALEAYFVYLRSIDQHKLSGIPAAYDRFPNPRVSVPNINQPSFIANDFFMIADVRNSPDEELINNFSTEATNNDVIFKLKLLANPPPQTALLSLVDYNVIVKFLPSGRALIRS